MECIEKGLELAFDTIIFCLALSILLIGIKKLTFMQNAVRERIGNEYIIVRLESDLIE